MSREVTISEADFVRPDGDGLIPLEEQEKLVLHRLRSAGIPVQGLRMLVGLQHGTLTIRRTLGGYRYHWSEI